MRVGELVARGPVAVDNAPLKGGRTLHYRCKECVAQFRRDRIYRECGFHGGTHTFRARNSGCSTLSKLRWILRNRGVPLMHDELSGAVCVFSMGLTDGRRLLGTWVRGHTRTLLMCIVDGADAVPLDIETAEMALRDYSPSLQVGDEVLSVGWTR